MRDSRYCKSSWVAVEFTAESVHFALSGKTIGILKIFIEHKELKIFTKNIH